MDIYIIRHAIAVEPETPGYEDDSQRPLTDKGHARMVAITRGLKSLDVCFDLILSSPYIRAKDTASILLKGLGMKKDQLVLSENLIPMGFPDQMIGEINDKHANVNSLAIVGHEPNLSTLISLLIVGNTEALLNIKKGGVCHLSADNLFHERRATLEWLMMPKHLIALGERS